MFPICLVEHERKGGRLCLHCSTYRIIIETACELHICHKISESVVLVKARKLHTERDWPAGFPAAMRQTGVGYPFLV